MKLIFSICRIFSFFFFAVYLFSSCTATIKASGDARVKKRVAISITEFNTTTGSLTLKDEAGNDASTFKVWPGQIIKWRINNKKIKSIDSMPSKPTYDKSEVFSKDPHKKILSKTWKGIIKKSIPFKAKETPYNYDYNIVWKFKENGQTYTYDPRIQIQPIL